MRRSMLICVGVMLLMLAAAVGAGKSATVRLQSEGIVAEIVFDTGQRLLVKSKPTNIPAGTYTVKSITIHKKDEKGTAWELHSMESLETISTLMVDAGQDKVLDVGPPVAFLGYSMQKKPPDEDTVHIAFVVRGRMSEIYYPGAFSRGRRPPAPTLKVVTAEGEVLHQASFVVAPTGGCTYEWKYPKGWKGKYRIEIEAFFGPFEWKVSNKDYLFEVN